MYRYDQAHRMLNQQVPCTTVQGIDDDEAVGVFRRLNQGGTALREGDVRAAELARGAAVNVLKKMREFVAQESPKHLGFGFSFAFRALVVFHTGSARFKALPPDWVNSPSLNNSSLAESWEDASAALMQALTFIDRKMVWSSRALVPSANAIIVLAYSMDKARFASPANSTDSDDERNYRSWLCMTALRGVFKNSIETTIDRFARSM